MLRVAVAETLSLEVKKQAQAAELVAQAAEPVALQALVISGGEDQSTEARSYEL